MKPKQLKKVSTYLQAAFLGINEIAEMEGFLFVTYFDRDREYNCAFQAIPPDNTQKAFEEFTIKLMLQMIKNCPRIGNL
jgi:hypothetical protein